MKDNTLVDYGMSIIEIFAFFLMVLTQNVFILSIFFIIKFIQYSILLNYENLTNKKLKKNTLDVLLYLKENGVFSFFNITGQIVSFGSIFTIALILISQNYNLILIAFLTFVLFIHISMILSLWDMVKEIKIDGTNKK